MLTILLALAFSLAVCAVVAFGATRIIDRVTATAKEQGDRFNR